MIYAAYENVLDQLLENLPRNVWFTDQLATPRVLNADVEFLGRARHRTKHCAATSPYDSSSSSLAACKSWLWSSSTFPFF
jgi:hypothetical protein